MTQKTHIALFGLLSLAQTAPAASAAANKLNELPADTWYAAPNTKMAGLCPNPYVGGNNGCKAVIESWNGGVYADDQKRLLVWGGGHGDYFGNEVYGFNVETMTWEMVSQPSRLPTLVNMDPLADGNPVSRHTYDHLTYISGAKKMFAYGGSRAGNGYATNVTWTLDLGTKSWKNMQPTGTSPSTACCNMSSDYDPVTRKVIYRDPKYIFEYDLETNKWTQGLDWGHDWGPQKSVIIPHRRLMFTLGSKEFLVYDIAAKKNVTADWKTTGGDEILNGYGPGMAYDTKADKLVAWAGGGVWVLDLSTKVWTRKTSVGAPGAQSEFGTYGRFRYIPEFNVFILVNSINQDVYFYKLTPGQGSVGIAPKTGYQAPSHRELILEPETPGLWKSIRVPLDGSTGPAQVSVYDIHGKVLARVDAAEAGRKTLFLPPKSKVCIVETSAPGMKAIRSMIVRG